MGEARQSFSIRTAKDFFHKLEEEYADFQQNPLSARHAINAAMTAWHLHEWLWAEKLKANYEEQKRVLKTCIQKPKEIAPAFIARCHDLSIMHDICNGSKHFKNDDKNSKTKQNIKETGVKVDYSSVLGSACAGRMFLNSPGLPYLAVTTIAGKSIRFDLALDEVVTFWRSIFVNY